MTGRARLRGAADGLTTEAAGAVRGNPSDDSARSGADPTNDDVGYEPERALSFAAADNAADRIGCPGEYPYTRGIYPNMYKDKLWTMRQYAGFGSAEETNRRLHYLLRHGQTGLSLAFDLPTQLGLDADHPLACGEVGKAGVSVSSLADMETLLAGLPLGEVSLSMTINATAPILLAMVLAVAEKQGVPREKLGGTVQNDILKEYVARGTYIFPPQPSMRLAVDLIAYCEAYLPRWNPISVSGYHLREAGATAAQEIGFALAHAAAYVQAACGRGLDVDAFAPRVSFFFAAGLHLFEEAAKFRAARRLWARLMKQRFGARSPKSMQLRVHAQTSGSQLTAQQPENNAARVTLQALGAVLGGTQSLHANALDEALGLPTEETARIALRTQQIIAYESGVTDSADPLAGSRYVEELTDRLEREAQEYMAEIERTGGVFEALRAGYMQRLIREASYRHQLDVDAKRRIVVGVNGFAELREERLSPSPLFGYITDALSPAPHGHPTHCENRTERPESGPHYRARQHVSGIVQHKRPQMPLPERLAELRRRRDNVKTAALLDQLQQAAVRDDNLMPYILDCVKAYATVGEICDRLRCVFGEYEEELFPWTHE
ncbi:acyl-CoA mutase large subunit family protein [Paenibacillus hamazuiensis]|uniref:acyl-CoA mutase large subunit family protein n=1 Tax=Paenibacillus hamazuiensis TaxID=2936508 RepID=UPI00200D1CCE|nr:methylmalonyl-CoA mutase family protein [Paenibacillus hamazuiensis]